MEWPSCCSTHQQGGKKCKVLITTKNLITKMYNTHFVIRSLLGPSGALILIVGFIFFLKVHFQVKSKSTR